MLEKTLQAIVDSYKFSELADIISWWEIEESAKERSLKDKRFWDKLKKAYDLGLVAPKKQEETYLKNKETGQFLLFDILKYDINYVFVETLKVIPPKKWDYKRISALPLDWLKNIADTFGIFSLFNRPHLKEAIGKFIGQEKLVCQEV
jgi:hypothetical protein